MKVIFKKALKGVAQPGDVKDVAEGYGRNFLIKNGYAIEATNKALEAHNSTMKMKESSQKVKDELLDETINTITENSLIHEVLTNEKGHMWSGIHKSDIVKLIKDKFHTTLPENLIHFDGVIKEIGIHKIKIQNKELVLELISKK